MMNAIFSQMAQKKSVCVYVCVCVCVRMGMYVCV